MCMCMCECVCVCVCVCVRVCVCVCTGRGIIPDFVSSKLAHPTLYIMKTPDAVLLSFTADQNCQAISDSVLKRWLRCC